MFAFIMRRLGTLGVILFGSSFLLFNLAAISGDPLAELRTSTDPTAPTQMAALTRELHLNVPPPLRYFMWLKGVLGLFIGKLDLGMTRNAESVKDAIMAAVPTTIRLVTTATITAIVLGITIGIITALRQYSKFDYFMTFVSFLLFSLPIFWVAVLLKQFMAIEFNNWLASPTIAPKAMVIIASVLATAIAGAIGGERRKFWINFAAIFIGSIVLLEGLLKLNWFLKPQLGIIGFAAAGVGVAYLMTQISVGVSNKAGLKSSITMVVISTLLYFPIQMAFKLDKQQFVILGVLATLIAISVGVSYFFAKIDRGPIIRTSILTTFVLWLVLIIDKLMRTWEEYMTSDAINGRPVPTVGQTNDLLDTTNYWMTTLDVLMHLVLPTIALTAISFAGYIRYSRGTMLEVLNQDYIRTARAKGLNERTVIMRHAFRNTMIPLTTIIVVDFAGIVGGAIITERVFSWKGMGTLFNQAINSFDLNLLMGVFFLTGTLALVANLIADLLYSVMDPRIRVGAGS